MGPVHRATTWDNSATTRLEWDGLGLLIRSFWFGVTYLRGKGGKLQCSLLLRLGLCSVSCTPVRWAPSSLIQLFTVTPYQRDSLYRPRSEFASHLTYGSVMNN